MAFTAADWSITRSTGDIRYIGDDHGGGSPSYATVIEFHRALQQFADDASSTGDDEIDITDELPSSRSTDNIIRLLGNYNIDDNAAEHLYDGSIIQGTGGTEEIYDGIVNFGNAGIVIQILQNGQVLADDWWNSNSGLNPDSAQGISHRFILKVRTSGADIDGRRLLGVSREFGKTYSEFPINGTSRGNNVLALTNASDLNNATAIATVAGWTGITLATEGFTQIDVDNNTTNEDYYSEWNTNQPTRSINDFFERMKWLQKDPVIEDSNADTPSADYIVGNGTLTGQSQSFAVGANAMLATKATFNLKKVLAPTGNVTCTIYSITGTHGTSAVPNSLLGTSDAILAQDLDTVYTPITFQFSTPVSLTASTNYAVAIEFTGGDGTNYVHVEGDSTGTHGGNQADETATVWTAAAAEDLNFELYTAPSLYGIPGNLFRGITHEVALSGGAGTWVEPESLSWGTGATAGTGQLLAVDNTAGASSTKMWLQLLSGVAPNANTITGNGGATATAGTVTDRSSLLTKPFIGASTGTAIIGGYGVGIETADLSSSDKLFDLTNAQITPPNNVTFTVSGLITDEDRVLVAPWDGSATDNEGNPAIDKNQLTTTAAAINGATVTSIPVTTTIPSDTPASGDIRIKASDGRYREIPYTSYSGTTFTIPSTDFSGANDDILASSDVWIAYIDKLAASTAITAGTFTTGVEYIIVTSGTTDFTLIGAANSSPGTIFTATGAGTGTGTAKPRATSESITMVYNADRDFVVIVRDGGSSPIKEFISSAVLSSTGGSITAIRTSDA
jgi:hypothetical protein